jgi:hypothetical protein
MDKKDAVFVECISDGMAQNAHAVVQYYMLDHDILGQKKSIMKKMA